MEPTKRQQVIFDFCKEYLQEFDSFPTLRAIAAGVGISQKSGFAVLNSLKQLERKGYIEKVTDNSGGRLWRFSRAQ
jgi:SOS-response transcriptional repressor LexA